MKNVIILLVGFLFSLSAFGQNSLSYKDAASGKEFSSDKGFLINYSIYKNAVNKNNDPDLKEIEKNYKEQVQKFVNETRTNPIVVLITLGQIYAKNAKLARSLYAGAKERSFARTEFYTYRNYYEDYKKEFTKKIDDYNKDRKDKINTNVDDIDKIIQGAFEKREAEPSTTPKDNTGNNSTGANADNDKGKTVVSPEEKVISLATEDGETKVDVTLVDKKITKATVNDEEVEVMAKGITSDGKKLSGIAGTDTVDIELTSGGFIKVNINDGTVIITNEPNKDVNANKDNQNNVKKKKSEEVIALPDNTNTENTATNNVATDTNITVAPVISDKTPNTKEFKSADGAFTGSFALDGDKISNVIVNKKLADELANEANLYTGSTDTGDIVEIKIENGTVTFKVEGIVLSPVN